MYEITLFCQTPVALPMRHLITNANKNTNFGSLKSFLNYSEIIFVKIKSLGDYIGFDLRDLQPLKTSEVIGLSTVHSFGLNGESKRLSQIIFLVVSS